MSEAGPPAASWFVPVTSHLFTGYAARYGSPIYLVGSALTEEHPCDYDVRVPLREEDMQRLFGDRDGAYDDRMSTITGRQMRRWREELKQSRRLYRALGSRPNMNIDFQFQAREVFDAHTKPRLRLDLFPDAWLDAGLGDP